MASLLQKKAKIVATGSYVPDRILSNLDLEKIVDTTDEWIFTRTGMKERRIAGQDQFTSHLGIEAAKKALAKGLVAPETIDGVIVATLTPDYPFPSTACLIQKELGLEKAWAFDIQAACTGYIYALFLAKSLVESQMCETILVIAPEKLSSIVDYTDRSTCVLFGDGAAACVVSSKQEYIQQPHLELYTPSLGADGTLANILVLPAGGSRLPASNETVSQKLHTIKMEGKEVFKHAVRRMEGACKDAIEKAGVTEDQIRWFVPHQANLRIIEALAKRFQIPVERVFLTLSRYGNTSASSVGIALDELLQENKVAPGEHILLTAFGAGLTWGALVLQYA